MTTASASLRLHGDDGAALLEFALLLPFLATIVFGVLDLGRGFVLKARLTSMAREGAFHAQFHPFDVTPACGPSISSVTSKGDASLTNVTVTVLDPTSATVVTDSCGAVAVPGTRRIVRVTTPMKVQTPFVGALVGDVVQLRGEAEVVVQG
jgi:Flp pilus assembly protein TadG